VQADPEWCGGISELLKIGTVASLYDVPVIPHGHSLHAALHVIASQSPMTFPLAEFLVIKRCRFELNCSSHGAGFQYRTRSRQS